MTAATPAKSRDRPPGSARRPLRANATGDDDLVVRIADGDEQAFALLYDRYAAKLLSFCRYLLGSRDEAQDAVQQTFMRAHQALKAGKLPDDVRPWLYAIARNRSRTMLAARRDGAVPVDALENRAALVGLADEVQQREDLRALVRDLDGLPDDQRSALVLFELGDLSQRDVAGVLDVPEAKVKALVHQARTHLIAERAARDRSCEDVRAELAVARGAALRRGPLKRHLKACPACKAYQHDVSHQRAAIAAVLPVAALAGSREGLFGALGLSTAGAVSLSGAGAAAGGSAAAVVGGAGTGVAAKVLAAVVVIGAGAGGTTVVLETKGGDKSDRPARVQQVSTITSAPTAPPVFVPAGSPSTNASTTANEATTKETRGRKRAAERHKRNAERKAQKAALQAARKQAGAGAQTKGKSAAAKSKAATKRSSKRAKKPRIRVTKKPKLIKRTPPKPAAKPPAAAKPTPTPEPVTEPATSDAGTKGNGANGTSTGD